MADITEPLQYGRLTGDFWAIVEDSGDQGVVPDKTTLMGEVLFTPSHRILRVRTEDVANRGVVYVDNVTAQVIDGVLVDDYGVPGVSLLASTPEDGAIFPHNISWTASFNLTMSEGYDLTAQPGNTQIRLFPGETRAVSDFIPNQLEGGGSINVVSVDIATLEEVNRQVDYINDSLAALQVTISDGVVKGDTGDDGPPGPEGPIGLIGPPGTAKGVETYNYVKNPTPTSNSGYIGQNGAITFANSSIVLTTNSSLTDPLVLLKDAAPAYPGTNFYLNFEATSSSDVPLKASIIFLDTDMKVVDYDTTVYDDSSDMSLPAGVVPGRTNTYTHMAFTDQAASFVIFSVGFSAPVPSGTTLTLNRFFLSDSPGFYFSGASTVEGYSTRWAGTANNSYSILIPASVLGSGAVTSVNGRSGDVVIDASEFGLDSVDNTPDYDKPVSVATQEALDTKLDIGSLTSAVAQLNEDQPDGFYLSEFSRYGTQQVWNTSETLVDSSYTMAPVGGGSFVRFTIPGTSVGNSASSIPTVSVSGSGEVWTVWKTLTGTPPSTLSYTHIDGTFDRYSDRLKVIVRQLTTSGAVQLHLFAISTSGDVTSSVIASSTTSTNPYTRPSIETTPANDGTLFLYYADSTGATKRTSILPDNTLSTTITNVTGIRSGFPAVVSRFYGAYVAGASDNSSAGSPGILVSEDGVSWRTRGLTGTHTWDRDASTTKMCTHPGVSKGRVGVFVEYIQTGTFQVSRLFATSSPSVSGTITGLATPTKASSSVGSGFSFPGTLVDIPQISLTSNDSRLNLASIATTRDGGTVERFNMGESDSSNATIRWTSIS